MNFIFPSKLLDDSINRDFIHLEMDDRRYYISARRRQLSDMIISRKYAIPTDPIHANSRVTCVASSWKYVESVSEVYSIDSLYLLGDAATEFGSSESARICRNLNMLAYLLVHQDRGVALPFDWNSIYIPYLRSLELSRESSVEFSPIESRPLLNWNMYPRLTNITIPIEYMTIQSIRDMPTTLRYIDIESSGPITILREDAIEASLSRPFEDLHTLMIPGVTQRIFLRISNIVTLRHLEVVMAQETHQLPVTNLKDLVVLSVTTHHGFLNDVMPQTFIYLKKLRTLEIISTRRIRYPDKFDHLPDLQSLMISLLDEDIPQSIADCVNLRRLDLIYVSVEALMNYDVRRLPENTRIIYPQYESRDELLRALSDPIIMSHESIYQSLLELYN